MKRDLITIDDLTNAEIESIFDLADSYVNTMADTGTIKIKGRQTLARDVILSTMFFEPSTRTRLSFETAMLRLGGHVISSDNPAMSSAVKGESIADCVRVIENYADIMVIRHPLEGAAKVAADFSSIPIINGGDGSHEHPTQTLCDLYTLRKEKGSLKGLHVLLIGDLKNGRTIHSLVYALARFGASTSLQAAKGLELPKHVTKRLREEFNACPSHLQNADVVYIAEGQTKTETSIEEMSSWRLHLDQKGLKKLSMNIDILYMTRLQKERLATNAEKQNYDTVVNKKFMKQQKYQKTTVLHPLPRNEELDYDMDKDPRGAYFRQAAYGVAIRMALITYLLELNQDVKIHEKKAPAHFYHDYKSPPGGIKCPNARCVTRAPCEERYLQPKFHFLGSTPEPVLRCVYCEHEISPSCYGSTKTKKIHTDSDPPMKSNSTLIFFKDADEALQAGFHHAEN